MDGLLMFKIQEPSPGSPGSARGFPSKGPNLHQLPLSSCAASLSDGFFAARKCFSHRSGEVSAALRKEHVRSRADVARKSMIGAEQHDVIHTGPQHVVWVPRGLGTNK